MKDITVIFKEIECLVDLVCMDAPPLEDLQNDTERLAILKTFSQDLEILVNSIIDLYKKTFGKTAGTVDIITTLSELIPENDLSQIKTTLSALAITDWFSNNPGFQMDSLAIAVEKRIQIMLDPKKNLNLVRRRLSLSEVELTSSANAGSVQVRKSRRALSQEITEIDQALEISNIIKSKYLNCREERIRLQLTMLEKLMNVLPETIRAYSFQNNTAGELIAEVRYELTHLNKALILGGRAAFKKCTESTIKCEELIKIILKQLIDAINSYLNLLKPGFTQPTLERLDRQISILPSLGRNLTQPIVDLQTYSELVDQFGNIYGSVFLDIYNKYNSLEERLLREKESVAIQHIESRINNAVYCYKLSSPDLRQSENDYLNELRQAYHSEKIIISTLDEDNSLQIYKDYRRGLVLNGLGYQPCKGVNDNEMEEVERNYGIRFRDILRTEFGEMNARNLIQHYNQNTAYLTSSPLITSLNREGELMILQPEDLEQRIYEEGGMVYREIKVGSFRVLPLKSDDPEDSEPWVFKCHILVQAWLSDEGFKVDAISTDCPLVALAYMQHSCSEHLLKLVNIIAAIKSDLNHKLEQLDEVIDYGIVTFFDPEGHHQNINKKQRLDSLLLQIKYFKMGKISLEDLIQGLEMTKEVTQIIPYASNASSYSLISLKFEQLIKWNEHIKASALPYQKLSLSQYECERSQVCTL